MTVIHTENGQRVGYHLVWFTGRISSALRQDDIYDEVASLVAAMPAAAQDRTHPPEP